MSLNRRAEVLNKFTPPVRYCTDHGGELLVDQRYPRFDAETGKLADIYVTYSCQIEECLVQHRETFMGVDLRRCMASDDDS